MTDFPLGFPLTPGCLVLIAAVDDLPEHHFLVQEVYADCITGIAQTGPLAGTYGEPDLCLVIRVLQAPS
ncbi:hypothetical protein [Thalassobacter stenotrophicus]|uniref:Uncharacterized protein n=2 Tax=Thalassobacter stenotrophicus TaxID=266809 RepID=A0A0N7LTG3_9RHOB|nr:hypothetical protein [Thalassobacter stenotrophicus]PVZ49567.1 hypothetical protein DD557_12975 [Thalassobacter stenotrophicus]CUH60618.1 hypothetical protein THS5294_01913 [Thalassobacter stenotrophicus]SHJ37228.1 hypothetical protein SAMN02744035_03538 [Thalassobacter stenotrophicus DSM 16310]